MKDVDEASVESVVLPDGIEEVEALKIMADSLKGFDQKTCARMLDYLADRFAACVLYHKHISPTGVVRARESR